MGSRLKKSEKRIYQKKSELETVVVEEAFSNTILLKHDWKSRIKVFNLNSKLNIPHNWCGGSQTVEL